MDKKIDAVNDLAYLTSFRMRRLETVFYIPWHFTWDFSYNINPLLYCKGKRGFLRKLIHETEQTNKVTFQIIKNIVEKYQASILCLDACLVN